MSKIILKWHSLEKYFELDFDAIKKKKPVSGLYIWGFMFNLRFVPYYVGTDKHIFNRIGQHVASILGGSYIIFREDKLKNFENYKQTGIKKFYYKESEYCPGRPLNIYNFYKRKEELDEHISFMVENFWFTYAIEDDRDNRKNAEKLLIQEIGMENLINDRGGDCLDFELENIPLDDGLIRQLPYIKWLR